MRGRASPCERAEGALDEGVAAFRFRRVCGDPPVSRSVVKMIWLRFRDSIAFFMCL